MKRIWLAAAIAAFFLLAAGTPAQAGEVDVLVQKLVEKNILSPAEAQIILDETKLQVSKDLAQQKSYAVPDWTQKVKMSGDLRVRTQGDWGKSNTTTNGGTNNGIKDQRWRNRIRGRFALEGKVNDFTYIGTRFAGGATNPRSTNDTMDGYWSKDYVMFDQYYTRFEVPQDIVRKYGGIYFNDIKLWAGRFPIPFNYSELVWDSDINPTGVGLQYQGPDIVTGVLPTIMPYSNLGMLWLDESGVYNTDPMLWAMQIGAKTEPFGPFNSTLNLSTAIYNYANLKDKTPLNGAGTNSRVTIADIGGLGRASTASPLLGKLKYEYNVLDLLLSVDNTRFLEWDFPHGLYADFITNLSVHEASKNKGFLVGGYIGKKKLKEPGDWKARLEWRYTERDAIPDFMPDSDMYGFGTWTSNTAAVTGGIPNWGSNGYPVEGGTNGKGINTALEYQLFKNTTLNLEYYWMKPISSNNKTDPWHELQLDVVTKF
ncbi:MAG: putative porin [Candidatus Omnitrophota bacterium]